MSEQVKVTHPKRRTDTRAPALGRLAILRKTTTDDYQVGV